MTKKDHTSDKHTIPKRIIVFLRPFINQITPILRNLFSKTPLLELLFIGSFCLALYVKNADFIYPPEVVLPAVLLGFLIVPSFYGIRLALRRFGDLAVHIAALAVSYQIYMYSGAFLPLKNVFSKLIPHGTEFEKMIIVTVLSAIIFITVSGVLGLVLRKYTPSLERTLFKILVFTVCFMFAAQTVTSLGAMWQLRSYLTYTQQSSNFQQNQSHITAKPNIYYLVFDRYGNTSTLKDVYGYDNTTTLNFLRNQGFTNREDALSNYPFTMQSISSTLRMDYHTDLGKIFGSTAKNPYQGAFVYRQFLSNPPVAKVLKQNGYQYNMLSSWWDFTRSSQSADTELSQSFRLRAFGKTFWMTDYQRDIINRGALGPILRKGLTLGHTTIFKYDLDRNPSQNLAAQIQSLQKIAAGADQAKPQFTFAHILAPHDPYVFMPDGSATTYDQNRTDNDIDEFTKYKNQLQYTNSELQKIVTYIREHDPQAVVIIQADEGPYPKDFRGAITPSRYYTPLSLSTEGMQHKFGALASYYLPGVSSEETAKIDSHVNVFRFVLSHYLGYDLPNLPDCHYAVGNKFNLYNFTDVSDKIDPAKQHTACKDLQ